MALQERLDAIREASKARIPAEARAVMERSVDDLRRSGIMDRIAKVGDKAPDFTLPATTAEKWTLSDLAGKKHVVLFGFIGAFTPT